MPASARASALGSITRTWRSASSECTGVMRFTNFGTSCNVFSFYSTVDSLCREFVRAGNSLFSGGVCRGLALASRCWRGVIPRRRSGAASASPHDPLAASLSVAPLEPRWLLSSGFTDAPGVPCVELYLADNTSLICAGPLGGPRVELRDPRGLPIWSRFVADPDSRAGVDAETIRLLTDASDSPDRRTTHLWHGRSS